MKDYKKIYFDFETTTNNPLNAEILQLCFLFVDNKEIKKTFLFDIKFNKKWEELTELEKDTLAFNQIYNETQLWQHNTMAKPIEEVLPKIIEFIKSFCSFKLPLTGWNNAGFDNLILNRVMERLGFKFNDVFDYHTRDIMPRYQIIFEEGLLKGCSLKGCHLDLIGTIKPKKFHNSYMDCLATKDLDELHPKIYKISTLKLINK